MSYSHVCTKQTNDTIWDQMTSGPVVTDSTFDEEFQRLFVQKVDEKTPKARSESASEAKSKQKSQKGQPVLISMKRATNVGIGLAGLKMSTAEIRESLENLKAPNNMTSQQLKLLKELLPNREEANALRAYRGPYDKLCEVCPALTLTALLSVLPNRSSAGLSRRRNSSMQCLTFQTLKSALKACCFNCNSRSWSVIWRKR